MTSIRVIDDAGDTHILDLYEDIVPKASYQFKDIRQPSFVRASFTDTFRVPATDNNIRFFGPLYDPTSSTSYVTKTKKKAFIEIETIPVFSGFLRLSKAIVQQGKFKEFEVSLFGDVVTLAKDLGEKLLSDLDFSGLDHDLTYANVLSSWTLGLLSGNVVYGMADYGARFGCLSTSFRDITNPDNALLADHLKPAVRLRAIIDAAFLAAGWTYESTHIDSVDFGKLYMPWVNHAGERMLLPGDAVLEKLFWAGMSADQTLALSPGVWTTIVATYDEATSPFYDAGGDLSAGGVFVAPADGVYTFEVNMPISYTGVDPFAFANIALYDTIISAPWASTIELISPSATVAVLNRIYTMTLEIGDAVQFRIQGNPSISGATDVQIEGGTGGASDTYWFRMIDAPADALGANINMTLAAPVAKALDLINDFAIMFNWVFIPDPDKENHMIIEPFKDYLEAGDSVDWRDKLDVEKDYTITPAAEFQKNKIVLSHQKDEDYYSGLVTGSEREDGKRVYGEKIVDNSDNDFSVGTELIETKVIASTPCAGVEGSIMVVPKFWGKDGAPIKPKPRVLYYGGSTPASATWYMENDAGTATSQIYFPYMGQFETFNSGLDDYDLAFGTEQPFHYIAYTTYNNLFYQYWQQYLKETYSEDGRVLSCWVKLTVPDILSLRFNDRLFLLGTEWRINKITNYGIGEKGSTQVELVKIISERRCAWLPDSVSDIGIVTMVDSEGSTGAGTQACCELFGYLWDGSQCLNRKKLNLGNLPTAGIAATPPPIGVEELPIPPPELRVSGSGGTRRSWAVGKDHQFGGGDHASEGFSGIFGLGDRGWARHDGEFFIGGGWQRSDTTEAAEAQARAQAGTILLMGEGDISTVGNIVDLKIMGRDNAYEFNPPDDSVTVCRVSVGSFTDTAGAVNLTAGLFFEFIIKNTAGTVTTTTSPVTGTTTGSTQLKNFKLSLTVASSLVALGLVAQNNGTGADRMYASARLDYTWARLR